MKTKTTKHEQAQTLPAAVAALHPDVDPAEQVTSSVLKVIGNALLVTDVDLKLLAAAVKQEQKRRADEAAKSMPKEGEVLRVRGIVRYEDRAATVIACRKSRAFVRVEGVQAVQYLPLKNLEKVS